MMNTIKSYSLLTLLFVFNLNYSQTNPFEITLEPLSIQNMGGIQSFAFGQHDGKWLIIGGRLDGLHRRQPWASFDVSGNNNELIVIDPVLEQKWSSPLTSLPTGIQEQLSSTNMEFFQEGDYLYCLGGYAFSSTAGDHITFPNLTAIKVSDVINSIVNNTDFSTYFRQINDTQFQVTGGKLKKIDNTYYLLGGQKFIGRYNPMGPNHGPGFIQEYTNAIRKFTLEDNGTTITINHLTPYIDETNLHRRDYNAESQILPNGNEGITMFSGVFQQNIDLPFLNSVTISADGYEVNNSFQQHYNHYHCPVLPLYSEAENKMHTVFFGGIAQFYDNNGEMVQDNNVPFVNTIARVTRDSNGIMQEYKLPLEMPALLGSGAEFIPNLSFPHFNNIVFKFDELTTDNVLIGYILGGINSTQANIFFINDGSQSSASNEIFKVFIKKSNALSVDDISPINSVNLDLVAYPNPTSGDLNISFNMPHSGNVKISIIDIKGVTVNEINLKNLTKGKNLYTQKLRNLNNDSIYFITIETENNRTTQKIILKNR